MRPLIPILYSLLFAFIGVCLLVAGFLFDPFSLPFQDYDKMQQSLKDAYEARAITMAHLRWFGLGVMAASLAIATLTGVHAFTKKQTGS